MSGPSQNVHGQALRAVNCHQFYDRLRRLKRLDLSRVSSEQTYDRFRRAFSGYITRSVIAGSNGVWRARVNETGQSFEDASDLWFPPADKVGRRGRFNEAGQSMFYCSDKIYSAIDEMRPSAGAVMTVLAAGAKSPGASLSFGHVGVHRAIAEPEIVGNMGGGLRALEEWIEHLDRLGIRRRWLALDDYLTEIAASVYAPSEQDDRYKMTNALARMLLQPPDIEGIIYPSVAAEMTAFNICLPPKNADKYFYPFETWEVEVVAPPTPGDSSAVRFLRKGAVGDSGQISWGPLLDHVEENDIVGSIGRSVAARRAI